MVKEEEEVSEVIILIDRPLPIYDEFSRKHRDKKVGTFMGSKNENDWSLERERRKIVRKIFLEAIKEESSEQTKREAFKELIHRGYLICNPGTDVSKINAQNIHLFFVMLSGHKKYRDKNNLPPEIPIARQKGEIVFVRITEKMEKLFTD